MEFEDLIGLNFNIMDKQSKLLDKYENNINILNLYPEYNLKGSYTSYSPLIDSKMKLFHLFPFFNHIIVDIEPYANEKIFEQNYGVNVEDLIDLHLKSKIFFRLPYVPQYYSDLENDYLDEILSTEPPCSFHVNYSHGLIINHNDQNQLKDINLFDDINFTDSYIIDRGEFDPLSIFSINMVNNYSNKIQNYSDNYYIETNKEYLRKLWSCGFNNIINNLKVFLEKDKNRLDLSLVYSGLYSKFLSDPVLESLDGTHILNYRLKYISNELNYRKSSGIFDDTTLKKLSFQNSDILNSELIKILNNKVEFPTFNTLESYDDIDYNGAKKALFSLENEISKKNPKNIQEYIYLLNEELSETKMDIESNNLKINNINKISLCVGIMGQIASILSPNEYKHYFDILSISSDSVPLILSNNKFMEILEKLSFLRKPNHVLFFFDHQDKVIINDNSILNKNSFKMFNDKLTEKYLYYEYLLDKIPSLKEYIAISSQDYINSSFSLTLKNNKEWTDELKFNFEKYITPSLLKKTYESILTYGVSYQVNDKNYQTNDIEIKIINPKYIRPIRSNSQIQYYKVIKDDKEVKISRSRVSMNNGLSFIENNIHYLDMMYPDITKKDTRIRLKWDFYELEEEKLKKSKTSQESLEILKSLLSQSLEFKNNIYLQTVNLCRLGNIYLKNDNTNKALEFYNNALVFSSKCNSAELKHIRKNIKNKIKKIKHDV